MISELLWTLIAVQMVMGVFDTIYHHELTERLAWRPSQKHELRLHAIRNWLYAILFATLGWLEPHGLFAIAAAIILAVEVVITLMDFVEEDLSRKLPATERINHTLLALNYGAILVLLAPVLTGWASQPTSLNPAYHGIWTWLCTIAALGTAIFGLRDYAAARRSSQLNPGPAAGLMPAMERRTILVTGATGFIGRRLVEALATDGHNVIALIRDPAKGQALPAPITVVTDLTQIAPSTPVDSIVNLAGEPIANFWWTAAKRQRIVQSRVRTTRALIDLVKRLDTRPRVLINGSAIGWYGLRDDARLDEASGFAPCFSHDLCQAWEAEARRAKPLGLRVVLLRTGLVLGLDGGLLSRMLTPFEFCLGGPLGDGKQWVSWISRDDLVRLIGHALNRDSVTGRLNGTAPHPVTNAQFTNALGTALGRPALLRMPAWLLRRLAGDLGRELLLGGQRVFPLGALSTGFTFRHPTIDLALKDLLHREPRASLKPEQAQQKSERALPAQTG